VPFIGWQLFLRVSMFEPCRESLLEDSFLESAIVLALITSLLEELLDEVAACGFLVCVVAKALATLTAENWTALQSKLKTLER
jgi:hypothetical protein